MSEKSIEEQIVEFAIARGGFNPIKRVDVQESSWGVVITINGESRGEIRVLREFLAEAIEIAYSEGCKLLGPIQVSVNIYDDKTYTTEKATLIKTQ